MAHLPLPKDHKTQLNEIRDLIYDVEDRVTAARDNDLDGEGDIFGRLLVHAIKLRQEINDEISDLPK